MDVESIVDLSSLEAWLGSLPEQRRREASVHIANRAALRVLPVALADTVFWSEDVKLTALPILWAVSITEVASVYPTSEIADAARAAANAAARAAASAAADATAANAAIAAANATNAARAARAANAAANAAATAANAAANAADFVLWPIIRGDAHRLADQTPILAGPLWPDTQDPFAAQWVGARAHMPRPGAQAPTKGATVATHGDWTFWVDWYEAHLAGEPFPASLLEDIIELPKDLWVNNPVELNRRVMEIYEAWKPSPQASAAIADFTYDPVKDWMNMVGFDGETAHIKDQEKAEAFFDDAEELRDGLQDFADFSADLRSGNNVGPILTTMSEKLLRELQRIDDKKVIRPGRWIELSGLLYSASLEQRNRDQLGDTLCLSLDTNIGRLRNLTKQHLSKTVERLEALNGLEMGQVAPSDMIARFEEVLDRIAAEDGTDFARLNPEDQAVLHEMLEEISLLQAAKAEAQSEEWREELDKRTAREGGALGATLGRYYEMAQKYGKPVGEATDGVIKNFKRWKSIEDLFEALKELLMGGPPPGA